MKEWIENNISLIIIIAIILIVFISSAIMSYLVRKNQVKKDKTKPINKNENFNEYSVKNIKLEDVLNKTNKNDNLNNNSDNDDNINIK